MKSCMLLLFVGCITSETVMAAPTSGSSKSVMESFWKTWVVSDYDLKSHPRKVEKSIFHFPTFRPQCGNGYEANDSGKCVKIIKIDKNEQDKVNLYLLRTKFALIVGDFSQEITPESSGVEERLRIHIPLLQYDDDETSDTLEEQISPLNPTSYNPPTTTTLKYTKVRLKNRNDNGLQKTKTTKMPARPNELDNEENDEFTFD